MKDKHVLKYLLKSLFIVFFILCSGCTQKPPLLSIMDEYETRLSRVLEIEVNELEHTHLKMRFPTKKDLKVTIPPLDINLREFYGINHCALAGIVANRNTALGKVQYPSQRLMYEHTLLRSFAACINDVEQKDPDLANKLESLRHKKQSHYPANWANMLQQSEETFSALTRKNEYIVLDNNDNYAQGIQDWQYLVTTRHPPSGSVEKKADLTQLEARLKRIANERLPATLWSSQIIITEKLHALNNALPNALANVTCANAASTDKATILSNVFRLFFINQLQPIGSKINELHYAFQPIMFELAEHSPSSQFSHAITIAPNERFERYQQTILEHVKIWQRFFDRCSINPAQI